MTDLHKRINGFLHIPSVYPCSRTLNKASRQWTRRANQSMWWLYNQATKSLSAGFTYNNSKSAIGTQDPVCSSKNDYKYWGKPHRRLQTSFRNFQGTWCPERAHNSGAFKSLNLCKIGVAWYHKLTFPCRNLLITCKNFNSGSDKLCLTWIVREMNVAGFNSKCKRSGKSSRVWR